MWTTPVNAGCFDATIVDASESWPPLKSA